MREDASRPRFYEMSGEAAAKCEHELHRRGPRGLVSPHGDLASQGPDQPIGVRQADPPAHLGHVLDEPTRLVESPAEDCQHGLPRSRQDGSFSVARGARDPLVLGQGRLRISHPAQLHERDESPEQAVAGTAIVRRRAREINDLRGSKQPILGPRWIPQRVQASIENAIETVLRLPPGAARLTVAGRTDAGVHARGQVCHLDVPLAGLDPAHLRRRLDRLLPDDIALRRVGAAPDGFDARFSALWRRYAYRVYDDPVAVDPLRRHEVLGWERPLDEQAMDVAAAGLLGEHDFAAFCKHRDGATTVRHLREVTWVRAGGLLTCRVVADAFCHHMVRSLVGCLLVVGEGKLPVSWPAEVLTAGVRDSRVPVVAARGLTLEEVGYPPDAELVARVAQSRAPRPG